AGRAAISNSTATTASVRAPRLAFISTNLLWDFASGGVASQRAGTALRRGEAAFVGIVVLLDRDGKVKISWLRLRSCSTTARFLNIRNQPHSPKQSIGVMSPAIAATACITFIA